MAGIKRISIPFVLLIAAFNPRDTWALPVAIEQPSHVVPVGKGITLEAINGDIATDYTWQFDDGASAAGRSVTHSWAKIGVFVITLTATSASGDVWKAYSFVNVLPAMPRDRTYEEAWELIRRRIIGTADWLEQSEQYAHYRFPLRNLSHEEGLFSPHWELRLGWTGGFWVGSLWRLYSRSFDPEDLRRANEWNRGILGEEGVDNHDRGFVYYNSSAIGYELTGNPTYLTSATKAAEQLAWMFNMGKTGLIPIFTSSEITIVDTMMNLQVLWWHHERVGDKPHLYDVAVSHAEKTRREFIRPDGSTWQSIHFNKTTGAAECRETRQGLDDSDTSTWSRGQAWAMYGFGEAWRVAKNPDFLAAAEKVSEFYLNHQPEDRVPWFDFSPRIFDDPQGHLKDSSTAAIAAAALLNLAEIHPDSAKKSRYRDEAEAITKSLIVNYLAPFGENDGSVPGMLLHGCWYWKQPERRDSELIWGTYYLLDALQRLLTLPQIHNATVTNLTTGTDQVGVGDPFQIEAQVSAHRLAYAQLVADLSQLGGDSETEPTSFDRITGKAVWSGLSLQSSPSGNFVVRLELTDGLGRQVEHSLNINVETAVENWTDHIPVRGDRRKPE